MKTMTIRFPNGNRARVARVPSSADGAAIAAALDLPPPRAVLLVHGGALEMSITEMARLRRLVIDGVARVAAEEEITVIDGGTQAGVMQMMGEGRAAVSGNAPLIGVCPEALVSWPGGPTNNGRIPLEPNHTHFVLTDGDRWGAETATMFALAAALSVHAPSLAILANGGSVAQDELLFNVRQRREVIVIRGSGRLADVVAATIAGETGLFDSAVASIVREGRITLFDITDTPDALAALIRQRLFGRSVT
jgi:hypothetical protein